MAATQVPDFISDSEKNGTEILYKNKPIKVLSHYFTCPCAIGDTHHHPEADLLMVILDEIGEKPFSWDDFAPMAKTEKQKN